MKLLHLQLDNFMGIKQYKLDTGGGDVAVYGDNGTGKTTLFSAFTWLLRDKDSSNRADFAIKTIGPDGVALPGLSHAVEGAFELDSGAMLRIKKVYKEVYTRKRGSAQAAFTGHTTDHFLDGVPVQKKDYDNAVKALIPNEEAFMLLTNPRYFNDHLKWTDRREILLNVCGDIAPGDVIANNAELRELPRILNGQPVEAHRKVVASRQREINTELREIPARIDEVARALPDLQGLEKEEILSELGVLQALIDRKDEKRRALAAGGAAIDLKVELADIDGQIAILRRQLQQAADAGRVPIEHQRSELAYKTDQLKYKVERAEDGMARDAETLKGLEQRLAALRVEYQQADELVFKHKADKADSVCPTCGQQLPADQLQQARDKAQADFNRYKATELADLQGLINAREADISMQQERLVRHKAEIAADKKGLHACKKQLAALPAPAPADPINIEDNAEYIKLMQLRQTATAAIANLKAGKAADTEKLDREMAEARGSMQQLQEKLAQFKQHFEGLGRMAELRALEQRLAGQYEELEREVYLMEQYTRLRVEMLTDKINDNFKLARFKLYRVNLNGGIEDACETMYNGVEWNAGLNNGAQLNIGIDIINTLGRHYGITAPIFIDNAESVTDISDSNAQLIKLLVSGKDKTLRVVKTKRRN